jgi:3-hydroxyisobutyrate dehydrogenase-like beta-hydroxyacid dehydrogenase
MEVPIMKVGFVGVGVMGAPIARNILKGGFPLAVYDIDGAATDRLVAAGAARAESPAAVTAASDVVITMVPDAPDVEQAALGPDGILAGAHPGLIYVDMSTIDPVTTRRVGAAMATRGVRMIDCPVGRTTAHAEAGRLLLMLGGDPQDIETVRPILACTADTFIYCGPLGNGSATKVVNNYLGMSIAAAAAETLALGVRAGLSVEHMLDVFRATMAANAQVDQVMRAKALADDFTPGFMVRLGHKDLRLALDMARAFGVRTPVGSAAFDAYGEACRQGLGREDVTSILRLREGEAGVRVRLSGR